MKHGYSQYDVTERFTLSNGKHIYVSYDNDTPESIVACIVPEVQANASVIIHQTVIEKQTH